MYHFFLYLKLKTPFLLGVENTKPKILKKKTNKQIKFLILIYFL